MTKRDGGMICNLLSGLRKGKVMAGVILVVMILTACSQGNSMDLETSEISEENEVLKESEVSEESESLEESEVSEEGKVSKEGGVLKESEVSKESEISEESNDNESSGKSENNKIEISMEDAISVGREEAVKYYNDLQLTEIHSYDNDASLDHSSGEDGKRQWWYVNFANENKNYVSILICDGEIDIVEHFDDNANTGLLDLSAINLTAEEAVKKAQEMGLAGGNPNNGRDWISGYHFKMSYGSLAETPDDIRIFLEVIGISPNGNFAHVDFDAETGECILAEEEVEYSNGEVEWIKFH